MMDLLRNALNFITAVKDGVVAFFKAYDEEVDTDVLGYPMLKSWDKNDSPYQYFMRFQQSMQKGPVRAALVFINGRRTADVSYLWDGSYQVGTACTNDLMIHVPEPSQARMTLQVSEDAVLVSSDGAETPVTINGHVSQFVPLVDQDECSFNKAKFYFIALPIAQKVVE